MRYCHKSITSAAEVSSYLNTGEYTRHFLDAAALGEVLLQQEYTNLAFQLVGFAYCSLCLSCAETSFPRGLAAQSRPEQKNYFIAFRNHVSTSL